MVVMAPRRATCACAPKWRDRRWLRYSHCACVAKPLGRDAIAKRSALPSMHRSTRVLATHPRWLVYRGTVACTECRYDTLTHTAPAGVPDLERHFSADRLVLLATP